MSKTKEKSGFTIIEVVLVLAIAGLIFLMVFLALPSLQRSQRDTQRKDDMSRFATGIQNYQTNNRGKVPSKSAWPKFLCEYMKNGTYSANECSDTGDSFADPDGSDYTTKVASTSETPQNGDSTISFDHTIYIYYYAKCDGENAVKGTGARNIAFRYGMENAGTYCGNI